MRKRPQNMRLRSRMHSWTFIQYPINRRPTQTRSSDNFVDRNRSANIHRRQELMKSSDILRLMLHLKRAHVNSDIFTQNIVLLLKKRLVCSRLISIDATLEL